MELLNIGNVRLNKFKKFNKQIQTSFLSQLFSLCFIFPLMILPFYRNSYDQTSVQKSFLLKTSSSPEIWKWSPYTLWHVKSFIWPPLVNLTQGQYWS